MLARYRRHARVITRSWWIDIVVIVDRYRGHGGSTSSWGAV
ncbi:MAG TPA: hypothetical protein PKA58_14720 [Polyangium sp.]|nr:hypothetical protein [Polyangium sp.]